MVHWEMGEILELLGCQNFEGFQLGIQGRGIQTVGFSLHEEEIFKVRGLRRRKILTEVKACKKGNEFRLEI